MAKGKSGRVVLEIDPQLKRELYQALATRDQTLKDWFLERAGDLLTNRGQFALFDSARAVYKVEPPVKPARTKAKARHV